MIFGYDDLARAVWGDQASAHTPWGKLGVVMRLRSSGRRRRDGALPGIVDPLLKAASNEHLEVFFDSKGLPVGYLVMAPVAHPPGDGLTAGKPAGRGGVGIVDLQILPGHFRDVALFLRNGRFRDVDFLTYRRRRKTTEKGAIMDASKMEAMHRFLTRSERMSSE